LNPGREEIDYLSDARCPQACAAVVASIQRSYALR